MENFDAPRLTYLLVLLIFVGGSVVLRQRHNIGTMFKQASAWVAIFVVVIIGYGVWSDIRQEAAPRQSVVAETGQIMAPRRADGHYYLTLRLNDTPIEFVVDTGATEVVLSQADARAIGLNLSALVYSGTAMTANGSVETAPARIAKIDLAGIIDRNVRVRVNGGEMHGSLLGMTYLRRFSRIEIADDTLILTR